MADLAAAKAAEESREVAPAETASPRTTQQRLDVALETLSKATANEDRFYALGDAARLSFLTGKTEEARSFANELLSLVPEFQANWNHDNAIHVSNIVLGRIALAEGRIDDAKNHLTTAGTIHGSPQLDTYGPDMSLANDLLAKGEQQVVLDYIELCRKFWSIDAGVLNRWKNADWLIWPTLGSWAIVLFTDGLVSDLALNAFKILMAAYGLQGLGVLGSLFEAWRIRGLFRMILYSVVLLVLLPLLLSIGFFDQWFDFRAKFRQS